MKHVYTSFLTFTLLTLTATTSFAQGPNDSGTYYQAADGKKGAELKTALCAIIKENHQKILYDDLWGYYTTTDLRDDGKIWDMYSDITNYTPVTKGQSSYPNEGSGYNREHSFPNSWFGGDKQHIAYADLFHLYPTDAYINNMRSNYCFGEVSNPTKTSQSGISKLGPCSVEGANNVTCFEPNDIYKGDFARTYFYMVTRYEDEIATWYTSYGSKVGISATLDGTTYHAFKDWQLNMLMKWAKNDPIDNPIAKETPRNIAVYGIQKNRNPFIDYPGLEEYIWGEYKDIAFSYDHYDPTPTIINVIQEEERVHDNVMYNLSGQVVDKSYKGIVIMNGKKFVNK